MRQSSRLMIASWVLAIWCWCLADGPLALSQVAYGQFEPSTENANQPSSTSAPLEARVAAASQPVLPNEPIVRARSHLGIPRLKLQDALRHVDVDPRTHNRLRSAGVRNLAQLRGRLHSGQQLLTGLSEEELGKLRQASILSLLSDNESLNAGLAKKGISSIRDLTRLSTRDLLEASENEISWRDAEVYKARAQALHNLISVSNWNFRKALSNPGALYRQPLVSQGLQDQIMKSLQGPDLVCEFECNEQNNIFSPAVYLLYLIDFFEKSFGESLDSLDEIERRFLQNFGAVANSQEVDQQDSYVLYTNTILENLIAATDPGDNIDDDLYKITNEVARRPKLEQIYMQFNDPSFMVEPGFRPNVLEDLFDSYVRELQTTRAEVQLVMRGSDNLKARFADQHATEVIDLPKIAGPATSGNISLAHIADIKIVILESFRRQEEKALQEEFITKIIDATEREFRDAYRERRSFAVAEAFELLLPILEGDPNSYPPQFDRAVFEPLSIGPGNSEESKDLFDQALFAARDAASECVHTGLSCPDASPWNGLPINFIKELFRAYPQYVPTEYHPTGSASDLPHAAFENLGQIRAIEHCRRYEQEDNGGTSRLMLLLEQEGKWNPGYGADPPTCSSLAVEGNLPDKSLQFAHDRLHEADGTEQQLQLRGIALGRFNQDRANADNATAFEHQVDKRATARWETAVSRAEQGFLEQIRTNLVAVALRKVFLRSLMSPGLPGSQRLDFERLADGNVILVLPGNVQRLGDFLFVDLKVEQTQRTTPLSFVIGRIQNFVQAARLGTMPDVLASNLDVSTWSWLKNYTSWHAAMMVSAYPENFLITEVRRNKTPQFERVLKSTDSSLDETVRMFEREITEVQDLHIRHSVYTSEGTFLFATKTRDGYGDFETFYSVILTNGEWQPWRAVPADLSVPANRAPGGGFFKVVYDGTHFNFFVVARDPPARGSLVPWAPDTSTTRGPSTLTLQHTSLPMQGTALGFRSLDPIEGLDGGDAPSWNSTSINIDLLSGHRTTQWTIGQNPIHSDWWETFQGGVRVEVVLLPQYEQTFLREEDLESRDECTSSNEARLSLASRTFLLVDGKISLGDDDDDSVSRHDNNICDGRLLTGSLVGGAPRELIKIEKVTEIRNGYPVWIVEKYTPNQDLVFEVWVGNSLINSLLGGSATPIMSASGGPSRPSSGLFSLRDGLRVDYDTQIFLVGTNTPGTHQISQLSSGTIGVIGHFVDDQFQFVTETTPGYTWPRFISSSESNHLILGDQSFYPYDASVDNNVTITDYLTRQLVLAENSPYEYGDTIVGPLYSLYDENDPVRVYIDEFYLHFPLYIADILNRQSQFEGSMNWLRRIYDPFKGNERDRRIYDGFAEEELEKASWSAIGTWLVDPFDPFATTDLQREALLVNVKLRHVGNLLDWADRLFTLDSSESVNRARELYELARHILGLHDWPMTPCELQRIAFGHEISGSDIPVGARKDVLDVFNDLSPTAAEEYKRILSRDACPPFKVAALMAIADRSATSTQFSSISNQVQTSGQSKAEDLFLGNQDLLEAAIGELGTIDVVSEVPDAKEFCLPINPLMSHYRWRIETNLHKIRTNRNFAGIERDLQPYATPVAPEKLVKQVASGGIVFEEFIPSGPPPIYRYSFLRERAKSLVQLAQQFESSMLSALEKEQQASYDIFKARQDLRLERANITLQSLRLTEARDSLQLADAQFRRVEFQHDHYDALITEGESLWENMALIMMYAAAAQHGAAAGLHSAAAFQAGFAGQPWQTHAGAAAASGGAATSSLSQAFSTHASHERRRREWRFQRQLAQYDIGIADIGVTLAEQRIDIVSQEKSVAELRKQLAEDTVEFLGNRTLNVEMYRWMNQNLRRLYREQLNLAIATAKAAQHALEFERQRSLDFIGFDYWDEDRRGVLGAEKLLADIEKMEQFRITTDIRKKEIEKTISLASVAPAEFQRFRETGTITFETRKEWFDRDFPGHYLRLVRDVHVSTLALVPPSQGIHATLSNPGISRVMVGPPFEEPSIIYRLPESIALSGAKNANGLFELRPEDPMLLPFEGSGVETTWQLDMPKGANSFDFGTIFDIYITIRYTALDEFGYRQEVLEKMERDEEGFVSTQNIRYFSLRRDFVDQWYRFNHPVVAIEYVDPRSDEYNDSMGKPFKPYTIVLDIENSDFLPNEDRRRIRKVTLAVAEALRHEIEDPKLGVEISLLPQGGEWGIDDVRTPLSLDPDNSNASTVDLNGRDPSGRWVLEVVKDDGSSVGNGEFDPSWLDDLLLVIEYRGKAHYGN